MFKNIIPWNEKQNIALLLDVEQKFRNNMSLNDLITEDNVLMFIKCLNTNNIVGSDHRLNINDIAEIFRLSRYYIIDFLNEKTNGNSIISRIKWYYMNFSDNITLLKFEYNNVIFNDTSIIDEDFINVSCKPLSTPQLNDLSNIHTYIQSLIKVPWYKSNKNKIQILCKLLDVSQFKMNEFILKKSKAIYLQKE